MKISSEIGYLLFRHVLQDLSADESVELEKWVNENETNRTFFEEVVRPGYLFREAQERDIADSEIDLSEVWQKLVAKGLPVHSTWKKTTVRRMRAYAAAASILVLLTAGIIFFVSNNKKKEFAATPKKQEQPNIISPGKDGAILSLSDGKKIVLDDANNGLVTILGETQVFKKDGLLSYSHSGADSQNVEYNTLSTPRGRQYQLALPDGSRIWLNASSSVTFPTAFAGKGRKITVSGEVYLEIAKDRSKPFIISVNEMEVEVYGTSFNINAYPEEANIKTTLIEGSIRVKNGNKTVMMKPGQQAQVEGEKISIIENADTEAATSWKNGMIVLDRADVHATLRAISRWYDVEVEVKGELVAPEFIGKLPRNLNLKQLLEALEMNSNLKFGLENRKVTVEQ